MSPPTASSTPSSRCDRGNSRWPWRIPRPDALPGVVRRALALTVLGAAGCGGSSAGPAPAIQASHDQASEGDASAQSFEVPPPPFSEGIFPCTDCHDPDLPVNTRRRELGVHGEIVLHHAEQDRWCLDCHDAADRDFLHLASGEKLPFEASYRLCGQCHGDKYRDWRVGVHGRRTGNWNGKKQYLLCVHCHDAHAPAFGTLMPEPAPIPPRRTP